MPTGTPTELREQRSATHPSTLDDHADALVRFAELAIVHDFPAGAITGCVKTLAAPDVVDVMARFELLVEKVRDQQQFNAGPASYAESIDWPTSDLSLEALDQRLESEIDGAVWSLLHPTPACVRCQRIGTRRSWRKANWPTSQYCDAHTDPVA